MSIINYRKIIFTLLLIALAIPSFAQLRLPGFMQRFQLGYSFVSTSADYKGKFTSFNSETFSDTSYVKSGNVKTSLAYGVNMGTYIPLTRLGNSSSLALDVNLLYNFMLWKGIGDGIYGTAVGWDFSGATIQLGLPVGLDYKYGCDAITNRTPRFCTSFGAGVLPSYSLTSFEDGVGAQFNMSPYIKAEAGIFAGICMKARVIYSFSSIPYISQKNGFGGVYDKLLSDFTLTGKSNVTFSLLLMPFSWNWSNSGWWNSPGSSPRMYKGWRWRHRIKG